MFDNRSISVMAYNLETILAEKLETVLSREIANTRQRDLYDIYILGALRSEEYELSILKHALTETTNRRGSVYVLKQYREIVYAIQASREQRGFWEKYRKDYNYAEGIPFEDICNTLLVLMDSIVNT